MHEIRQQAIKSQEAKVKAMDCDKPFVHPSEKAEKLACGGPTGKKED